MKKRRRKNRGVALILVLGSIAIMTVMTRLRESFGPSAALDIPGLALIAASAFAVVWGLLRGNAVGWASAEALIALIAGLLLAAGFVAYELRASAPMVPMRLFRSRALSSGIIAGFLLYGAMYGVLFLLPQFLHCAPQDPCPMCNSIQVESGKPFHTHVSHPYQIAMGFSTGFAVSLPAAHT